LFNGFKINEINIIDFAKVVPMVIAMLVAIANHTSVVLLSQIVIDVCQVVAGNVVFAINPHFSAQLAIASLGCDVVRFINDFLISHDVSNHT
jgi:hypothetical protein